MFTLDQSRMRMRRIMLAADTTESGAGPQTASDTVAALDALDGGAPQGQGAAAEGASDVDEADDTDPDGADELGDKGKQALERMKERLRNERAARRAAEQALAEQDGADDAKKVEREALAKANQRIVRSEVKAAAKGVLADPADAYKFLDLSQFEVEDDGSVDEDEIADAIKELVEKKPYLAAQGGPKSPKPDPSQGAVGGAPATAAERFAAQFRNF